MKVRMAAVYLVTALLIIVSSSLYSQEDSAKKTVSTPLSAVKDAPDWQSALAEGAKIIGSCQSYDDYEKLASELKKTRFRERESRYPDIFQYMCAKTRVEELAYLTNKNDIDSGRIYMSVSEKCYNDALSCLSKALQTTKSKDLGLSIYFLEFMIYKEIFQPEKVESVFNEIVGGIAAYSSDTAVNIAKLNEISRMFGEKGLPDYAMKLKLLYASKVGPESAKRIADEIKVSADNYFDEGRVKEAIATYDTYLQLAENYYNKETMAAKVMDIAEKHYNKGRYKEAVKYYSSYLFKYGDSRPADYCSYKLGLSLYNNREYQQASEKFENFLNTYQNSVWFEKAFESLSRIYYEKPVTEQAIASLQALIEKYPRRDSRDYAYMLIGVLRYGNGEYDKALEVFGKIETDFPSSAYGYAAGLLIQDAQSAKKGARASYSFGSKDPYKVWEPYTYINGDITVGEGATVLENKDAKPGEIFVKAAPGAKVAFSISGLEDLDRFNEYSQDKDDQSRLPRKTRDGVESDLLILSWSSAEGGKFVDDKQTLSRVWQAPNEPGNYTISVNIGDLGLVRPPDSGSRKDPAKTLTIHILVEK